MCTLHNGIVQCCECEDYTVVMQENLLILEVTCQVFREEMSVSTAQPPVVLQKNMGSREHKQASTGEGSPWEKWWQWENAAGLCERATFWQI